MRAIFAEEKAHEHIHNLPLAPEVIGLCAFGILAIMLIFVLLFGKGREHC